MFTDRQDCSSLGDSNRGAARACLWGKGMFVSVRTFLATSLHEGSGESRFEAAGFYTRGSGTFAPRSLTENVFNVGGGWCVIASMRDKDAFGNSRCRLNTCTTFILWQSDSFSSDFRLLNSGDENNGWISTERWRSRQKKKPKKIKKTTTKQTKNKNPLRKLSGNGLPQAYQMWLHCNIERYRERESPMQVLQWTDSYTQDPKCLDLYFPFHFTLAFTIHFRTSASFYTF